jgi:hypothetical protein
MNSCHLILLSFVSWSSIATGLLGCEVDSLAARAASAASSGVDYSNTKVFGQFKLLRTGKETVNGVAMDTVVLEIGDGEERAFPLDTSVIYRRDGEACAFRDLRAGDRITLTVMTPPPGAARPRRVAVVSARSPDPVTPARAACGDDGCQSGDEDDPAPPGEDSGEDAVPLEGPTKPTE